MFSKLLRCDSKVGFAHKIISSSVIVYYYYKARFTAVYREKAVFSLVNAAVVRKKLRRSPKVGI